VSVAKGQLPLCVDCHLKFQRALAIQAESSARLMNYLRGAAAFSVGLGPPPTMETSPFIGAETVNVGNVSVTNSSVGVINTGAIETVNLAVEQLQGAGGATVAEALKGLANAISSATDLTDQKKKEALELLGSIASEAAVPEGSRKVAVVKAVLSQIPTVVSGAASVADAMGKWVPIVSKWFGLAA
jgi:hypothetical protein